MSVGGDRPVHVGHDAFDAPGDASSDLICRAGHDEAGAPQSAEEHPGLSPSFDDGDISGRLYGVGSPSG